MFFNSLPALKLFKQFKKWAQKQKLLVVSIFDDLVLEFDPNHFYVTSGDKNLMKNSNFLSLHFHIKNANIRMGEKIFPLNIHQMTLRCVRPDDEEYLFSRFSDTMRYIFVNAVKNHTHLLRIMNFEISDGDYLVPEKNKLNILYNKLLTQNELSIVLSKHYTYLPYLRIYRETAQNLLYRWINQVLPEEGTLHENIVDFLKRINKDMKIMYDSDNGMILYSNNFRTPIILYKEDNGYVRKSYTHRFYNEYLLMQRLMS